MKTVVLVLSLVTLIASAPPSAQNVLDAESRLNSAIVKHDTRTAGSLLTDDYVLITSNGVEMYRDEVLKGIADAGVVWTVNRAHDQGVRLYNDGKTAIVTGILDQKATAGKKSVSYSVRYTDTWVLIAGAWREASGHASLLR